MKVYKEIDHYGNTYYRNELHQFHREDGPAIEGVDGFKEWFLNGKTHRIDGPACISSSGYKAWYIHGEYLTEEEFTRRTTRLYKILYSKV